MNTEKPKVQMAKEHAKEQARKKHNRALLIDKFIDLTLFILGFLIALGIDKWKGDDDNIKAKNHYLKIVWQDVNQDIERINACIKHDSIRYNTFHIIIDHLDDSTYFDHKPLLDTHDFYLNNTLSIRTNKGGYNSVINQNVSKFLENISLEMALSEYYSFANYIHWLEDYYLKELFERYIAFRIAAGDMNTQKFIHNISDENKIKLINHCKVGASRAKIEMGYYKQLKAKAKELQNNIKKEVKFKTKLKTNIKKP